MKDVERRIRAKIEAFVAELTELVAEAALQSVAEALRGLGKPSSRKPAPRALSQKTPRGRASGTAKRSRGEIDETAGTVLAIVEGNPGLGVIAIARELGTTTKDLVLPIKRLMSAGAITSKGQKRATKYYPGSDKARAAFHA
jgi:hypothetical protein